MGINTALAHRKYIQQSKSCAKRVDVLGNQIEMRLSFDEWLSIWEQSGYWANRGNRRGQYVMSRKNDIGHYELGNVVIQLHSANIQQAQKRPDLPTKAPPLPFQELSGEAKRRALGFPHPEFGMKHSMNAHHYYHFYYKVRRLPMGLVRNRITRGFVCPQGAS